MKLQAMILSIQMALCKNAQAFSLLANDRDVVTTIDNGTMAQAIFSAFFDWLLNLVMNFIYTICKWAMNVIDFFQILSYKLIGVGNVNDYKVLDTSSPLLRFLTDDVTIKVFTTLLIIAIVLVIVFTIMAIIRAEYITATGEDNAGAKSRIFKRVIKSLGAMLLFPCVLLASIILINAILASLMTAFNPNPNATVGSNIFIASAYNANNYRNYANSNARIPILINFEDPEMYQISGANSYTPEELEEIYKSWEDTGKSIYSRFAYNNFETFSDTIYYKNNIIHNKTDYSGFEKFVCTPEQYQVMADFIDYAVANNLTFYIKAYNDEDVSWKYVTESVYDSYTQSITINYANSTGQIGTGDYYTMIYQADEFDFSTPIQATLQTINQILSIGEYEDYQFKMLERIDNDVNMVRWKTQKVKIQLSADYKNNPTATDQLILYEYYRKKADNTFNNYSLQDLEQGIEDYLSVMILHNTRYSPSLKEYVEYASNYVCLINNSYYLVKEKQTYNDGKLETWYELDEEILNSATYLENGTTVKTEYVPQADEVINVVEIEPLGVKVKLETDEMGRALLYSDLRVNYNYGDSKYDEIYNGSTEGILNEDLINSGYKIYVDTLEDVCVTGTWTEKLVNDLQVIYKDININTLINTDQWLSAFSEMYNDKSYITTENTPTSTFNTTLIHPLGLIQAELFLGEVEKGQYYDSYAEFVYSSSYNDSIIKALFISMLGEDLYLQAYKQYQVFMDLYNCMMSSVLDETAFYEFFDIVEEANQSIQLYTYKAYLSSVLLSTDVGNYLYDVAYTIVNSNNLLSQILQKETDEDGNVVGVVFENYNEMVISLQNILYTPAKNDNSLNGFNPLNQIIDYESLNEVQQANAVLLLQKLYEDNNSAISEEEAIAMLKSSYNNYVNSKEALNTLKVVLEYWQKERELNEEEYEFLTALETYMSDDGFSRSWAMANPNYANKADLLGEVSKIAMEYTDALISSATPTIPYLFNKEGIITQQDLYDAYTYYAIKDSPDYSVEDKNEAKILSNEKMEKIRNYVNVLKNWRWAPKFSTGVGVSVTFSSVSAYSDLRKFVDNINLLENGYGNNVQTLDFTSAYHLLGQANSLQDEISNYASSAYGISDDVWKNILGEELFNELNDIIDIENGKLIYSMNVCRDRNGNVIKDEDKIETLQRAWYVMLLISTNADLSSIDELEELSVEEKTARGLITAYVTAQQKLDMLNLYNIQYSVSAYASQIMNNTLKININNRTYTAQINMGSGKFVEYVLGYDKLVEMGYTPVFIDSNYQGILSQVTVEKNGQLITTDDAWAEFKTFLNKFGQACVDLSNKSTFARLENQRIDTYTIDLYADYFNNQQVQEIVLSGYLANFLVDNLSTNILTSFIKIDETILNTHNDSLIRSEVRNVLNIMQNNDTTQFRSVVVDLLDYLGLDKEYVGRINAVDITQETFTGFTLSQYKKAIMTILYDYEAIAEDTSYDNQQRYLTLVYLVCADWQESENFVNGASQGDKNCQKWIKPNLNTSLDLDNFYNSYITTLRKDSYSVGLIMRMSGLENRNESELVGLEFTNDLNAHVKSEEAGDVFVICTYDEKERAYYPFLMTNSALDGFVSSEQADNYRKYLNDNNLTMPYTTYYGGQTTSEGLMAEWYPVIAKGVITEKGYPTTIKENNGNIEFYRNDVRIVNTSKLGLSTYFNDTSMIIYRGGIVSTVVNYFTKKSTGKTLTETALSTIPRIAIESGLHFAYGNSYVSVAQTESGRMYLDYNFYPTNAVSMENLFSVSDINVIILVFSIIFLFIALWKMVWGLMLRIFDVTVLSMLSPAIFSTMAFTGEEYDKKSKQYVDKAWIYEDWLQTMKDKLLSVFGFVVALNIFFILVPIIKEFTLFTYVSAFAKIPIINKMSVVAINALVQNIMFICAIYTIKLAPQLVGGVMGVKTNLYESGEQTINSVKAMDSMVREYTSGRNIVNAKNKAIGLVQASIPGYEMAASAAGYLRVQKAKIQANVAARRAANNISGKTEYKLAAKNAMRSNIKSAKADYKNGRISADEYKRFKASQKEAYRDFKRDELKNMVQDNMDSMGLTKKQLKKMTNQTSKNIVESQRQDEIIKRKRREAYRQVAFGEFDDKKKKKK